MDVRVRIKTTTGRDYEGSVAVFVPERLRHREKESTAWWWSEAGQKAEGESLFTIGAGGSVVRVRATDAGLSPIESPCASLLGTQTVDAREGRIYVGSLGELPQSGSNLRRPEQQFLPLPTGRYLVDIYRITPPRRARAVHSSALVMSQEPTLFLGGAKPAKWSVPALEAIEEFSLDPKAMILAASERALLLLSSAREVVTADIGSGVAARGAKLGAHEEVPTSALPWNESTWALCKGQYLVLQDVDAKRELRRINVESPIVALRRVDECIVVLASDGRLIVIDMDKREIKASWSSMCGLPSGLLVHRDVAIVTGLDGDAHAIDLETGARRWTCQLPVHAASHIAFDHDAGIALIGGAEGGLCLLNVIEATVVASQDSAPVVGAYALARDTWIVVTPDEIEFRDGSLRMTEKKVVIRRKKDAIAPEALPDLVLVFRPPSRTE